MDLMKCNDRATGINLLIEGPIYHPINPDSFCIEVLNVAVWPRTPDHPTKLSRINRHAAIVPKEA
jgi:hypothetical protein